MGGLRGAVHGRNGWTGESESEQEQRRLVIK